MAEDRIENYGLKASFGFEVDRKTFVSLDTVQSQLAGIESAVRDASSEVKRSNLTGNVSRMATDITKQLRPIKSEFRALKAEMRNLEFGDLTNDKEFKSASKAVDQYANSLKHLQAQITGTSGEERELSAALKQQQRILKNRMDMNVSMREASKKASEIGEYKFVADAGRLLFNQNALSAGKDIVGLFAGFDDTMSAVAASIEDTGEQYEMLRKKALLMGATTRYTAKEAADAEVALAMAGFKANEVLSGLPATLSLASAGQLALGEAADISSNILSGFTMKANQLIHVTDVLAKTATATNSDIQGLGVAMSYAAPNAKLFGASIEETSALIGTMSNAGIKADKAGTAARGAFLRLSNATPKGVAALKSLGVEVADSGGNMRNVIDIFRDISTKLQLDPETVKNLAAAGGEIENIADLGQRQKLGALKEIFGTTGISGAAAVLSDIEGTVARTLSNIASSTNTDQLQQILSMQGLVVEKGEDVFTALLKAAGGDYQKAKEILNQATGMVMQTNISSLDDKKMGQLKSLLESQQGMKFKEGEDLFVALNRKIPDTQKAIALVNTAMEELGLKFADEGSAAKKMAQVMENNLAGSFRSFGSALESVKINFVEPLIPTVRFVVDSITKLLLLMSNLPQPIKAVISFSGALVLGMGALAIAVGTVGATLTAFRQALLVTQIAEKAMVTGMVPLTGFFATSLKAYEDTNPAINALKTVQLGFTKLIKPVNEAKIAMIGFGRASLSFAVSPVGLAILALTGLYLLLEKATPEFSLLGSVVSALVTPFAFVFGIIKGFFEETLSFLGEITGLGSSVIAEPFLQVGFALKTVVENFNKVAGAGEEVGKNLAKAIISPFRSVGNVVNNIWKLALVLLGLQLKPLTKSFDDAVKHISESWRGFIDGFGSNLRAIIKPAMDVATGLINALNHFPTVKIPIAWEGAVEKMKSYLEDFLKFAIGIGVNITNAFSSGFTSFTYEILPNLIRDIAKSFSGVGEGIGNIWNNITGKNKPVETMSFPFSDRDKYEWNASTTKEVDEILAKRISYVDFDELKNPNTVLPKAKYSQSFLKSQNLEIVNTIEDTETGFAALLLKSTVDNISKLVIRGSTPGDIKDIYDDLVGMPGDIQFEKDKDLIQMLLEIEKSKNRETEVIGHSLGGALTQMTGTAFPALISKMETFNTAGVSQELIEQFKSSPSLVPTLEHSIHREDITTLSGDGILPGKIDMFTSKNKQDDSNLVANHASLLYEKRNNFEKTEASLEEINNPNYKAYTIDRTFVKNSIAASTWLAALLSSLTKSFDDAVKHISESWRGFIDGFGSNLRAIIKPAMDVATGLINALNHFPTVKIPIAWEGAVEKMKSYLEDFLKFAIGIGVNIANAFSSSLATIGDTIGSAITYPLTLASKTWNDFITQVVTELRKFPPVSLLTNAFAMGDKILRAFFSSDLEEKAKAQQSIYNDLNDIAVFAITSLIKISKAAGNLVPQFFTTLDSLIKSSIANLDAFGLSILALASLPMNLVGNLQSIEKIQSAFGVGMQFASEDLLTLGTILKSNVFSGFANILPGLVALSISQGWNKGIEKWIADSIAAFPDQFRKLVRIIYNYITDNISEKKLGPLLEPLGLDFYDFQVNIVSKIGDALITTRLPDDFAAFLLSIGDAANRTADSLINLLKPILEFQFIGIKPIEVFLVGIPTLKGVVNLLRSDAFKSVAGYLLTIGNAILSIANAMTRVVLLMVTAISAIPVSAIVLIAKKITDFGTSVGTAVAESVQSASVFATKAAVTLIDMIRGIPIIGEFLATGIEKFGSLLKTIIGLAKNLLGTAWQIVKAFSRILFSPDFISGLQKNISLVFTELFKGISVAFSQTKLLGGSAIRVFSQLIPLYKKTIGFKDLVKGITLLDLFYDKLFPSQKILSNKLKELLNLRVEILQGAKAAASDGSLGILEQVFKRILYIAPVTELIASVAIGLTTLRTVLEPVSEDFLRSAWSAKVFGYEIGAVLGPIAMTILWIRRTIIFTTDALGFLAKMAIPTINGIFFAFEKFGDGLGLGTALIVKAILGIIYLLKTAIALPIIGPLVVLGKTMEWMLIVLQKIAKAYKSLIQSIGDYVTLQAGKYVKAFASGGWNAVGIELGKSIASAILFAFEATIKQLGRYLLRLGITLLDIARKTVTSVFGFLMSAVHYISHPFMTIRLIAEKTVQFIQSRWQQLVGVFSAVGAAIFGVIAYMSQFTTLTIAASGGVATISGILYAASRTTTALGLSDILALIAKYAGLQLIAGAIAAIAYGIEEYIHKFKQLDQIINALGRGIKYMNKLVSYLIAVINAPIKPGFADAVGNFVDNFITYLPAVTIAVIAIGFLLKKTMGNVFDKIVGGIQAIIRGFVNVVQLGANFGGKMKDVATSLEAQNNYLKISYAIRSKFTGKNSLGYESDNIQALRKEQIEVTQAKLKADKIVQKKLQEERKNKAESTISLYKMYKKLSERAKNPKSGFDPATIEKYTRLNKKYEPLVEESTKKNWYGGTDKTYKLTQAGESDLAWSMLKDMFGIYKNKDGEIAKDNEWLNNPSNKLGSEFRQQVFNKKGIGDVIGKYPYRTESGTEYKPTTFDPTDLYGDFENSPLSPYKPEFDKAVVGRQDVDTMVVSTLNLPKQLDPKTIASPLDYVFTPDDIAKNTELSNFFGKKISELSFMDTNRDLANKIFAFLGKISPGTDIGDLPEKTGEYTALDSTISYLKKDKQMQASLESKAKDMNQKSAMIAAYKMLSELDKVDPKSKELISKALFPQQIYEQLTKGVDPNNHSSFYYDPSNLSSITSNLPFFDEAMGKVIENNIKEELTKHISNSSEFISPDADMAAIDQIINNATSQLVNKQLEYLKLNVNLPLDSILEAKLKKEMKENEEKIRIGFSRISRGALTDLFNAVKNGADRIVRDIMDMDSIRSFVEGRELQSLKKQDQVRAKKIADIKKLGGFGESQMMSGIKNLPTAEQQFLQMISKASSQGASIPRDTKIGAQEIATYRQRSVGSKTLDNGVKSPQTVQDIISIVGTTPTEKLIPELKKNKDLYDKLLAYAKTQASTEEMKAQNNPDKLLENFLVKTRRDTKTSADKNKNQFVGELQKNLTNLTNDNSNYQGHSIKDIAGEIQDVVLAAGKKGAGSGGVMDTLKARQTTLANAAVKALKEYSTKMGIDEQSIVDELLYKNKLGSKMEEILAKAGVIKTIDDTWKQLNEKYSDKIGEFRRVMSTLPDDFGTKELDAQVLPVLPKEIKQLIDKRFKTSKERLDYIKSLLISKNPGQKAGEKEIFAKLAMDQMIPELKDTKSIQDTFDVDLSKANEGILNGVKGKAYTQIVAGNFQHPDVLAAKGTGDITEQDIFSIIGGVAELGGVDAYQLYNPSLTSKQIRQAKTKRIAYLKELSQLRIDIFNDKSLEELIGGDDKSRLLDDKQLENLYQGRLDLMSKDSVQAVIDAMGMDSSTMLEIMFDKLSPDALLKKKFTGNKFQKFGQRAIEVAKTLLSGNVGELAYIVSYRAELAKIQNRSNFAEIRAAQEEAAIIKKDQDARQAGLKALMVEKKMTAKQIDTALGEYKVIFDRFMETGKFSKEVEQKEKKTIVDTLKFKPADKTVKYSNDDEALKDLYGQLKNYKIKTRDKAGKKTTTELDLTQAFAAMVDEGAAQVKEKKDGKEVLGNVKGVTDQQLQGILDVARKFGINSVANLNKALKELKERGENDVYSNILSQFIKTGSFSSQLLSDDKDSLVDALKVDNFSELEKLAERQMPPVMQIEDKITNFIQSIIDNFKNLDQNIRFSIKRLDEIPLIGPSLRKAIEPVYEKISGYVLKIRDSLSRISEIPGFISKTIEELPGVRVFNAAKKDYQERRQASLPARIRDLGYGNVGEFEQEFIANLRDAGVQDEGKINKAVMAFLQPGKQGVLSTILADNDLRGDQDTYIKAFAKAIEVPFGIAEDMLKNNKFTTAAIAPAQIFYLKVLPGAMKDIFLHMPGLVTSSISKITGLALGSALKKIGVTDWFLPKFKEFKKLSRVEAISRNTKTRLNFFINDLGATVTNNIAKSVNAMRLAGFFPVLLGTVERELWKFSGKFNTESIKAFDKLRKSSKTNIFRVVAALAGLDAKVIQNIEATAATSPIKGIVLLSQSIWDAVKDGLKSAKDAVNNAKGQWLSKITGAIAAFAKSLWGMVTGTKTPKAPVVPPQPEVPLLKQLQDQKQELYSQLKPSSQTKEEYNAILKQIASVNYEIKDLESKGIQSPDAQSQKGFGEKINDFAAQLRDQAYNLETKGLKKVTQINQVYEIMGTGVDGKPIGTNKFVSGKEASAYNPNQLSAVKGGYDISGEYEMIIPFQRKMMANLLKGVANLISRPPKIRADQATVTNDAGTTTSGGSKNPLEIIRTKLLGQLSSVDIVSASKNLLEVIREKLSSAISGVSSIGSSWLQSIKSLSQKFGATFLNIVAKLQAKIISPFPGLIKKSIAGNQEKLPSLYLDLTQNLKKQEKGDTTPEVEGNIKRLREQISAKESEITKQQATLSNLQASAQTTANAWARTLTTFKANTYRMARIAMVVGTRIVNALNHGAADVTGEAWQRNEPIVANEMQKMGEVAVATGNEINAAMGGAAEVAVKELQKVEATAVTTGSEISTAVGGAAEVVSNELHQTGQAGVMAGRQISGAMEQSARKSISVFGGLKAAVQSIGKAGFAIGGAVTAMGFAAQTVSYSLSSMGIISEYESEKLYKVTQLITLIGAIGGIVAPVLGAMFSSLGAIAAVVGTVVTGIAGIGGAIFTFLVSPVGLAVAGITAGIFAINYLIKSIFGVDLLQNLISSMLDGIGVAFNTIKEQLPGIATGIWTAISPMAEKIKPIFDFLWKGIQDVFLAPFAPILEKFQPVLDLVVNAFDKAVNQISGAWEYFMDNFGGRLMQIVDPALDVAKRLINALNHNPTEKIPLAWEGATKEITGNIESLPVSAQVAGNDINSALSKINNVDINKNSILKTGLEGLKSSGIINDKQSSAIDYALVKSGVMNKEDIQELNQAVSELKDPTLLLQETAKKLSASATQLRMAVMGLTLIQKPADIVKAYKAAFEGKAKEQIKEQITAPVSLHGIHSFQKLKPHKPKFTVKQLLNKEFQNLKKQVAPFIQKITETLFPLILANPFIPYVAGITAVISLFEILTPKVNVLGVIAGALSSPFAFMLGVVNGFIEKLGIVKDSVDAIKSPFVVIYDYAKDTFNTFAEIFNKFFSAGETVGENLAIPFLYAKEKIQAAWQGFVEWFEQMPLVKMAGDVAQGLINALNHNPTEKIPLAWEGATEKMKSYLDNFLKYALTVAGAMTAAFSAKKIFGMMQGSTNPGVVGAAANAGKLSGKIKSFSMYANLTNDIAGLSGNELPGFVKPIITATTAIGVMVDMGESVLPKLAGAFGKVSGMVGGLSTAIGAMSPLLSVTLVGAIALFATAWFNNLFGIQDKTKAALEWIGQAFQDAITTIQGAWQGFIDNFGGKLASIVQPALDVAQALINALNHNPTERIPQAWEGATEKITGNIESLPVSAQVAGEDINSALSKIDSVNLSDKISQGFVAQKLEGMIQRSLASGKTNQESLRTVAEAGYKAPKMFSDFVQWLDQVITEKVGSGTGNPSIAGKVVSTSVQAYKNYQEEKESFKHLEDYGQTEPVAQISRFAVGISEIFEKLLPVLVSGVNPIMATGEASLVTAAMVKAAQNKAISTAVIKGSTKLFEQQVGVPIGIAAPEFILNADKSGFDKQNNIVNADKSGFDKKNNIVPLPKRSNFIDPTTPLPEESGFIGPVMPREEGFIEKITSWFNGLLGGNETTLADNVLLGSIPNPGQSNFIGPMMPPPLPGESQFIGPVMPREESFIEKITSWFNGLFGGNKANNAVASAPLPDESPVLLDFTKQIDTAIKLAKYDGNKAAVSQLSKLLDLNYQEQLQELLSSSGKKLDDPELQGQIQELFNSSRGQLTANQYAEVITKPETESPGGRYLKLGQELKNSVDNPSTIKDITDQMGRDFNGFVADVKSGSSDAANNLALEFEDRWDYLQRNGFTNFGEIFEPGMDEMRSGLGQLGESFQVFGNDALRSLKTLDFKSLDKAMSDFGTNAWSQLKQIGEGFASASLSAIAFGMFSLLSLSPVNLAMIAVGAIVLAITTNFLGLRDVLFIVVKVAIRLTQIIIALGQAVAGVINGIQIIAKGILSLNKDLLMTGVDKIATSVKTPVSKALRAFKARANAKKANKQIDLDQQLTNEAPIVTSSNQPVGIKGRIRNAVGGAVNQVKGFVGLGKNNKDLAPENNLSTLGQAIPKPGESGFIGPIAQVANSTVSKKPSSGASFGASNLKASGNKTVAGSGKFGSSIDAANQVFTPALSNNISQLGFAASMISPAIAQPLMMVGALAQSFEILKDMGSDFVGVLFKMFPALEVFIGKAVLAATSNTFLNKTFGWLSATTTAAWTSISAAATSLWGFITSAWASSGANTFLSSTYAIVSTSAIVAGMGISAAATSLWGFITSAWASSGASTFLSGTLLSISATATAAWISITTTTAYIWGFITSAFAAGGAGGALSASFMVLSSMATIAWGSITATASSLWGFVASAFTSNTISTLLAGGFAMISTTATAAYKAIISKVGILGVYIIAAWKSSAASASLSSSYAIVSASAMTAWGSITATAASLWGFFTSAFAAGGINGILSSSYAIVSASAMTAWGSITATASSLWGFVTSALVSGGANTFLSSTYATVSTSAIVAGMGISTAATSLLGFIASAWATGGVVGVLSATFGILSTAATAAWVAITGPMLPFIVGFAAIIGVLAAVYIAFKTNFLVIGDLFSGFFGTLFEGFGQIFGGVFNAIKQGFSDIVGTFAFVGKAIMQPFQPLFDLFSGNTGGGMFKSFGVMFAQVVLLPFRSLAFILTGIIKIITILIQGIAIVGGLISGVILSPFYLISFVVRGIVSLVSGIGSALSGSFNAIVDFIRNVPVLGNILTLLFPKENYQPQKYATGGLITGSGTSTNDSIPIMASRNEYMVNAAATRQHYGLLEAINNGEDLPGMTAIPIPAPRIIQPPSASEYASVSRGAIAMPPMEFNFNFGDIIVQGSDGGASAANEFLESLEPQLEQKVREIMQKMLEFMK